MKDSFYDERLPYGLYIAIEKKPANMMELCRKTGYSRNAIKAMLEKLTDKGLIVRRADNKYQSLVILLPVNAEQAEKAQLRDEFTQEMPRSEPAKEDKSPFFAKRFKIPVSIGGQPLSMTKRAKCSKCTRFTAFRYGGVPWCATCARATEGA